MDENINKLSYPINILKNDLKFFWYTRKHTKMNNLRYKQLTEAIMILESN